MTPIQALQKYFGYGEFSHQQEAIIQHILNGRDVLALMPTGGAFQDHLIRQPIVLSYSGLVKPLQK